MPNLENESSCMKRHLHFPLAGLVLLTAGVIWSTSATAQMTGFVVEVDTVFYGADTPTPEDTFDLDGTLDGYASFIVYAEFTNTTDVLSALFADTAQAAATSPLLIDAPCGCFNPIASSVVMNSENSTFSWSFLPENEYDTFFTIGHLDGDNAVDVGALNPVGSFTLPGAGSDICSTSFDFGGAYVLPLLTTPPTYPPNSIAGEDFRVAVARVTTCGDWKFAANCQVFVEGDQDDEQVWLIEEQSESGFIEVSHPCLDYASQDAAVTGLLTTCPGDNAEVNMQFLGSPDVDSTTYTLYAFDDGFVFSDVGQTILDFTNIESVAQTSVPSFSDVEPGDYAVLVLDDYGCMDTTMFTVVSPDPIEAMPSIGNDNSCFGEADASIVIPDTLLVGGTGGLNVSVLSPSGEPIFEGAAPDEGGFELPGLVCQNGDGTFVVTTTDENGCFRVDSVSVNCPEPIEWTVDWTDVVCAGAADGTIVAEASGGSGENLYLTNVQDTIEFLSVVDTLSLTPLTASIDSVGPALYQVWVYDDFNCTSDTALITVEEPAPLVLSIDNVTDLTCESDCDGSIEFTATGGSGQLEVQFISMPTGTPVDDSSGLCVGDFLLQVTDTAGCNKEEEFFVDAPPPLFFLPWDAGGIDSVTCTGMSDGTIDLLGAGGTATDGELSWYVLDSAGQQVATNLNPNGLNNLSEMTYTAHVTDQIGCTHDTTFTIGVLNQTDMELSTLTSPVTCWGAADGTATVSVNGGEAPFTFEWSDPFSQTASTAVGLDGRHLHRGGDRCAGVPTFGVPIGGGHRGLPVHRRCPDPQQRRQKRRLDCRRVGGFSAIAGGGRQPVGTARV